MDWRQVFSSEFRPSWRLPECPFDEYHCDRESQAEILAIPARVDKLPSEVFSSLMRCISGVTFDSYQPAAMTTASRYMQLNTMVIRRPSRSPA